jgi:hypothetical protein
MYGILFGNVVTLVAAVTQHWSPTPLLCVYWGQSVVIGIMGVIRILRLREFSTDGFQINGRVPPPTRATQVQTAQFFAMHYGIFHLVYAVFLFGGAAGHRPTGADARWILGSIATFAIAHGWSLARNHGRDFRQKTPNIGSLMFYPYLRILPMHLAIILGATFGAGALPFFIALKTVADVLMHVVERRLFRGDEAAEGFTPA